MSSFPERFQRMERMLGRMGDPTPEPNTFLQNFSNSTDFESLKEEFQKNTRLDLFKIKVAKI